MLSGAVDFAIDNLASYISLIQSGKMRALAVTSAKRWPTLPDVPTMVEAGVKDFVVTSWAAFVLDAEAVPGGRRAHSFQHAGGGHRVRRNGAGDVEGRG
jgi:tripartite-type tricarboxylate transporter receptor subunit TctC